MFDIQKNKTETQILNGLTQILKKKKFEDITVKDLADFAGISRSSFYTYYHDKYQLVEQCEAKLFDAINDIFTKSNGDLYLVLLKTFNFINEKEIYSSLISINGSYAVQQLILYRLKVLIEDFIYKENRQKKLDNSISINRYKSTYYATAIMGVTQEWIRRGNVESSKNMANTIYSLIKRKGN